MGVGRTVEAASQRASGAGMFILVGWLRVRLCVRGVWVRMMMISDDDRFGQLFGPFVSPGEFARSFSRRRAVLPGIFERIMARFAVDFVVDIQNPFLLLFVYARTNTSVLLLM